MEKAVPVLKKYIDIIESGEYDSNSILPSMVKELYESVIFSGLNGEELHVRNIVDNLIKYNEDYEGYPITEDRIQWILKDFHDQRFDFDAFEKGVMEAMDFVEENYEE